MARLFFACFICIFAFPLTMRAMEPEAVPDFAVFVRVLDVGNGLATIAKLPGQQFVVFDIGFGASVTPASVINEVKNVTANRNIDLLFLSHADENHYRGLKHLLDSGIKVGTVVRTGYPGPDSSWKKLNRLLRKQRKKGNISDINLSVRPLPLGSEFNFGEATFRVLSGFNRYPHLWEPIHNKKKSLIADAIGLVVKLEYRGAGVLFTADGLANLVTDSTEAQMTERFLLQNRGVYPLNSEALIAPRGAGPLASSTEFIDAVLPEYLIVSAGHGKGLPDANIIQRYLDRGIAPEKILRTDIGDDEPGTARRTQRDEALTEWSFGRNANERDQAGDEHIDILICPNGKVRAAYASQPLSCVWDEEL